MFKFKRWFFYVFIIVMGFGVNPLSALTIEVTGGEEGALPIAIVPFGFEGVGPAPIDIAAIIAADLRQTGHFAPLANNDIISQPHAAAEVRFEDWRLLGTENLVIGLVRPAGPGNYNVQFELFDVFKAVRLTGLSFTLGFNKNPRQIAHRIADIIYQQLTGERGVFNTKIAYITAGPVQGKYRSGYTLQIADADGHNSRSILTSKEPLLSPAWSPDGERIAYVSFENRRPLIYIQDLSTGNRQIVASYPGINSAPAWSPDGRRLAVSLSKDGNSEIYILDLASRAAQRITNNTSIDTEPAWSPDGNSLVFTSDRSGSPQIYRIAVHGGVEERVTFQGSYNAHAQFAPDGRRLAFVHGNGAVNNIALLDLDKGETRRITRTNLDESPNFAPNGTMIVYASEEGGRGILKIASVTGRTPQRLNVPENDVREPAWGPLNKKLEE